MPNVSPNLLAGLIVDEAGEPLVATHACKGRIRYRYYVSRALQHSTTGNGAPGIRLPSREIEAAVAAMIVEEFDEPLTLAAKAWITFEPSELHRIMESSAELAASARKRDRDLVRQLVAQVRLFSSRVEIDLSVLAIAEFLGAELADGAAAVITLTSDMRLTRTDMAVRLIQNDRVAAGAAAPDPALLKLVLKARHWWAKLKVGDVDRGSLAAQEGVSPPYISRVLPLAFLASSVVEAILEGKTIAALDGKVLTAPGAVAIDWLIQRRQMLGAAEPGR